MKLTLITPQRKIVDSQEVREIVLTTESGQIQMLPGHTSIVGLLAPGIFRTATGAGQAFSGFISSGYYRCIQDEVVVVADTLELSDEIDSTRAKKAQEKAEATLKDAALEPSQFRKYELKLQRALIRQQIASGRDF